MRSKVRVTYQVLTFLGLNEKKKKKKKKKIMVKPYRPHSVRGLVKQLS